MVQLLTVTGRDVLFAHWPLEPDAVERRLPPGLTPATFDGSAWVSVLALENPAVTSGAASIPTPLTRPFPQCNLRTYVTAGREKGVYFLSLDSGSRAAATAGRRVFGLPFHTASMRLTRQGETVTFQSRRPRDGTDAVFQARYRPDGRTYHAESDTLEAFCVESFQYFIPSKEDHRPVSLRDRSGDAVLRGTISRDPWELRPVAATVRENTLFEAAGLPTPDGDPRMQYSPGFEMGVEPLERVENAAAAPE